MSDCSRRKFLKSSVLFGTAAMIGCNNSTTDVDDARVFVPPPAADPTATSKITGKVPTAVLGKTGVKVPILSHGGTYDLNNIMVGRALDLGINYFDTADCYMGGESEVILGKVLEKQGRRKDAFIVSKNHPRQPTDLLTMINQRLERLRTDYLDLYFMHQLGDGEYPAECVNWPKDKTLKEVVEKLKQQKKIRFFGFSCHAGILPQALENAAEGGFVDAIMFRYNFRNSSDELNRAIDKAKKAGIGLIAMKTQGGKVLYEDKANDFKNKGFNIHQATLKAVWADNRIDTIVSSMNNLKIVEENATASLQNQIGALERQMLDEYAKATNHLVCHGCDHICSPHVNAPVRIGDTLRYMMYHDNYGDQALARELFNKFPQETRDAIMRADFTKAEAACPFKLQIGDMMADALVKLGGNRA